ncbi:hypothetical protein [Sulfurovum sp.]|uniref:hypothetical protein n=1 Tax=Sulfurovum sp. TaxID=1969726 RepID=UPI0028683068|nr:hypothetical protein [Sulfurovum sp.]
MHKKLKKYIERYDDIQDCTSYELMPNGGMIVLINQDENCEIIIKNKAYKLESSQAILINAYEESVQLQSNEELHLIAVRFKGAGASFFYEEQMDALMQVPNEPMYIEKNILERELDTYLLNRLTPSKLPFNIMKIIELLDEQGSDYSIDEVLAIANIPRKILDKMFNLRTGLTFKTYATVKELAKSHNG